MNQLQKFARPSSRARVIGRTTKLPPLGRPAAFNHDQMYDDRRAGARSRGCDRHAPVRVNLFHGRDLPVTGRDRIGSGPFRAERRDCSRAFAKPINSAEHSVHDAVQPFKRHSKNSLRYGPEPKRDGAQKNGNGSQEDGVS